MQPEADNEIDIKTELQKLIKHISSLKTNYKSLYDGLPDLLRTINTDGIILDCNIAYAEHLGYSKNELVGTSIFDSVAEESLQALRNSFETWKVMGSVRNREIWFKRKDGSTFPALVSANNLYDEEGKLIGSNTIIKDISDIYQIRKKLEESKEKNFEKDKFINTITSDLKSSSIHIMNVVKILASQNLGLINSDQLAKLEEIKSKSRSIIKILSDTADMQKIANNELTLYKSQHNLSQLTADIISKLKEDADSHGSVITTELEPNVSCVCDKTRIEQLLTQVITNAIDFSPKGSGKIHIKAGHQNEYAKIVVKDNGIGIQTDKLEKIFEKFYHVATSILSEYGGAGLGLSICRGIIDSHNGKIWAESKGTGAGTEIHILLPLFDKDSNKLRKI
ncbi:MAG: PAS domain-containing sensor histidine kinase [Nitrosopumilaceae archaeon]